MKNKNLDYLINLISSNTYPILLTESKLKKEFKDLFKLSPFNKSLIKTDNDLNAVCSGCEDRCAETAFYERISNKFYISCPYKDEMGLVEIEKDELVKYKFDFKPLLEFLNKELGLKENIKEEEPEKIWFIGKQKDTSLFFIRNNDFKETIAIAETINESKISIIWLGENSKVGHSQFKLISIFDLVDLGAKSLIVKKSIFDKSLKNRFITKHGDIELDKNIVVGQNYILFDYDKKTATYKNKEKIKPQAFKIIQFLFNQRNNANFAFSIGEFESRAIVENKRAVSSRIGEIQQLCSENNIKPIFHKYQQNKWGLNKNLSSCN